MKILYAFQGVGNGHVARARQVIPEIKQLADVDVAVSGDIPEVALPVKPEYNLHGLGFKFGKHGGIDYLASLRGLRIPNFFKEIRTLPVDQYDLVINDFEPVSAYAARRHGIPSVSFSHQASFLSPDTPRPPSRNPLIEFLFKKYAPCQDKIGLHFARYDSFIHTPVIRNEVRELEVSSGNHITVYLPGYGDEYLVDCLRQIPQVEWDVFTKHGSRSFEVENVRVRPINNVDYLQSLASCKGLLTGGGFEAPAEALFLGKNLLVIPLRGQYEQHCNAVAASELGVPMLKTLSMTTLPVIAEWATNAKPIKIYYPDETKEVIKKIVASYEGKSAERNTDENWSEELAVPEHTSL